jgi:competence protein ComEC
LIGALILDDRHSLDFALSESYSYVGITHFLALSGMHLGAIAIPLSKILSRVIRSKRIADVTLFAILCLYSAVAGFPASLVRALFLCAAVIAYRMLGLHTDLLGALITGSFVIVSIDPSIAFDAGFRLSFAAVCGIALVGIPVSGVIESLLPGGLRGKAIKAVLFPAVITCSVQFLTMPLTLALFKRSSLLSPLANVIVSLPFTILLYAGVLYVFVPLALMRAVVGPPINLLCRFLAFVPAAFSRRPHEALLHRDFNAIIYLAGVALVAIALRKSCERKRRLLCAGIALIAIAFAVPECAHRIMAGSRGDLSESASPADPVSFGGGVYVSDGGGVVFVGEGFSSGESYRLVRVLWAIGVRRIECCVVKPSKLKKNHGLFYLLKRMQVNEMVCSPYLLEGSGSTIRLLRENGVKLKPMRRGDSLVGKCWRLDIEGPVYPPRVGSSIARGDADLRWCFLSPLRDEITQLDLERSCGYHAGP